MSQAGIVVEIANDLLAEIPESSSRIDPNDLLNVDEVPVWLNETFIERILQKHFNEQNLKVKSLEIQECGGKGESYASIMYRVGVFYSQGKSSDVTIFKSLIVKTLPEHELALEKLGANNYNVQNKEMEMYEKTLPEFERVLELGNDDINVFPKVIGIDRHFEVIVLEDLAQKKFVMADRIKGLDQEHTMMALRKLARLHAASVIIQKKDPKAFANIDKGFFTRSTNVFHVMFESLCDAMIEEVATWKGFEYYSQKLPNVRKNLISNAQKSFDCADEELNVLNHGDLWTNNLMYRYDEAGRPIDAVLLDFQFAFYGSPALDLMYFLYTSTADDIRLERMDELIQYYYQELRTLLLKLNNDMKDFPSLHEFNCQVLKKQFYAFTSGLLIFAVMITQDKDSDFEALMGLDEHSLAYKKRIFKNPRYQAMAKKILPLLDAKGILDDM